jgi:hypothetical protein
MRERAFQAAADEPRVERVVAVLDQYRPEGEPQKGAPRILELRRADEHRSIDVVALARVGVDGSATVDKRVEEGQRAAEAKALGADLQHEERCVSRGLDVEGDELRVLQRSLVADLGRVDRDLLPRHQLGRAARLEVERFGAHQRASARARRAQVISSSFSARSSSTNAA